MDNVQNCYSYIKNSTPLNRKWMIIAILLSVGYNRGPFTQHRKHNRDTNKYVPGSAYKVQTLKFLICVIVYSLWSLPVFSKQITQLYYDVFLKFLAINIS
jgi:hypothetical protein